MFQRLPYVCSAFLLAGCPDDDGATGGDSGSSTSSSNGSSPTAPSSDSEVSDSEATDPGTSNPTTDPTTSDASTDATTSPATDTGSGSDSSGSTTGVCAADEYEPNENEDGAENLGELPAQDEMGGSLEGTLDGPDDEDWFTYHTVDGFTSAVNPSRELVFNGSLRVCTYFTCDNEPMETTVTCPAGTDAANSSGGWPGCCVDGGPIEITPDCTGITDDDSGTVYIQLLTDEAACVEYTLNYHA